MKIYIAGPMTGRPDWNYPAFFAADEWLGNIGIEAINPAKTDGDTLDSALFYANNNLYPPFKTWDYYLRKALVQIADADGVLLLPGWQDSKGARLEVHVAKELGMPLYIERDGGLVPRVQVIGLSGYARAGKDTVGQFIIDTEMGWERVSFADPMREALYRLNPFIGAEGSEVKLRDAVDEYGWEEIKKWKSDLRPLMQRFGTEVGREMFGDSFWVDYALDRIPDGAKVVFTDVRFPNEADAVKALGGQVWRVERPGCVAANGHASETAMDGYDFDYVIYNDSDLETLQYRTLHGLERLG